MCGRTCAAPLADCTTELDAVAACIAQSMDQHQQVNQSMRLGWTVLAALLLGCWLPWPMLLRRAARAAFLGVPLHRNMHRFYEFVAWAL